MIKLNEIIPSNIVKNEIITYKESQGFIDVDYKVIKEKKEKKKIENKKQFLKIMAILSGTFLFLNTIFIACILFKSGLDLNKIIGPAVGFLLLAVSHNVAKEAYYND
jgi:hypothetical protein